MGWLVIITYIILFVVAIAAWVNTKIILDEIGKIKKHLGVPEDKPLDFIYSSNNTDSIDKDQKDKQ